MLGTREYTLCSPFRANAHNSSYMYVLVIEAFYTHILGRLWGMIQTIIEVFSFIYMGSTLLCGSFSKWPYFEKKNNTNKEHSILHCC